MAQRKILIIDDDYSIVDFLKTGLALEGFLTDASMNYLGAKDKIRDFKPDLILMDINMPDRDGVSFSREIRLDKETSNIPIIVVTASDNTQTKLDALMFGVVDYVTKPFEIKDLKERILKALAGKKAKNV